MSSPPCRGWIYQLCGQSVGRVPAVRKSGLLSLNYTMAQTTLRWFSRSSHRLPICLPTRWAKGRKSSMQGDADNAFLPKAPAFCRLLLCSPVLLFPRVLWETHGSVCWSPPLLPSLFRLQLDWLSADICWVKSEPRRTQGQLALHWTGGMFLSCPLIQPIPGLTHPSLGSLHLSANLLPVIVSIMPLWSLTLNIGFWGAGGDKTSAFMEPWQ